MLHHQTLKAAVGKYLPLFTEGKSEEDIKAEIAADPKEFDAEAINEIYEGIVNFVPDPEGDKGAGDGPDKGTDNGPQTGSKGPSKQTGNKEPKSFVVAQQFRDKDNFDKLHKVGADVSHFSKTRLKKLVDMGLVIGK